MSVEPTRCWDHETLVRDLRGRAAGYRQLASRAQGRITEEFLRLAERYDQEAAELEARLARTIPANDAEPVSRRDLG